MKTIWRYKIQPGSTIIEMPLCAEFLHLRVVDNYPSMYFLVDPDYFRVDRLFITKIAGQDIAEEGVKYLGTFQQDDKVYHVMEGVGVPTELEIEIDRLSKEIEKCEKP